MGGMIGQNDRTLPKENYEMVKFPKTLKKRNIWLSYIDFNSRVKQLMLLFITLSLTQQCICCRQCNQQRMRLGIYLVGCVFGQITLDFIKIVKHNLKSCYKISEAVFCQFVLFHFNPATGLSAEDKRKELPFLLLGLLSLAGRGGRKGEREKQRDVGEEVRGKEGREERGRREAFFQQSVSAVTELQQDGKMI